MNTKHLTAMKVAYEVSNNSRDTSTKVGCVIMRDEYPLTWSWNGFPRHIDDNIVERYNRPLKYTFTEHAERNAINNCARGGISTLNAILYTTLMPCHECARSIIQAGIRMVVYSDIESDRFKESSDYARIMFKEANVELIKI